MGNRKLGHAVIGYGGMGGWHCANVAEKLPQIAVKGVWDVREEAREKAAASGLFAYASLEELLATMPQELIHQTFGQFGGGPAEAPELPGNAVLSGTVVEEAPAEASQEPEVQVTFHREFPKVGRNDPCPCGSGKKYKKCCGKE